MKHVTTTVLALASIAIAVPAFAGNPEPAPVAPTIAPAAPIISTGTDWTGAYGGLSLGYAQGGDAADNADGRTIGAFGGYQMDLGDFVVGGEVSYDDLDQSNAALELENVARLKLRAGYDLGDFLLYGTVGAAYGDATIGGTNYSDTGVSYGVGVDYAVTDNISTGLELLQTDFGDFDNSGSDVSSTSIGARVAFRF